MVDPVDKPDKGTLYNDRMKNIWNMPGNDRAPRSINYDTKEELERNAELNVTDELKSPYRGNNVTHLLQRFEAHCQKDAKNMDHRCVILLGKIEYQMKIQLELNDRQLRRLTSKMLCVTFGSKDIEWYDPSKQLCCKGLHDIVTGEEMCCSKEIDNGMYAYNMEIYNKSVKLCCDGRLFDKTRPSQECCGQYVYDTATEIGCCEDQLYDTKYKFCCANRTLHHNIGRRNIHGGCCGAEKYDERCYSCNNTLNKITVYPIFDPETQRCCHGRIKTINENKTACCGKQLINEAIHKCVDNIVVARHRMLRATSYYYNSTPYRITAYSKMGYEIISKASEVNFKEQNATSKNQQWTDMRIILPTGSFLLVLVVAALVIFAYKRRLCICKKKEPPVNVCGLNNTLEQPTYESIQGMANSYEAVCESGYQSLQNASPYISELFLDGCGVCTSIPVIGSNNEPYAINENASNTGKVFQDIALFEDTVPDVTVRVDKLVQHSDKNFTSELFTNAETQTFPAKESNQRDIFGRPYQYSCYLDQFNRTLQWDKSETKMTLPLSAVTLYSLHVQASSFDDIPAIYKKLCLSKDTRLAGPVVEYCLTGCKTLDEHARVELPVINDGKQKFDVLKFRSDEGMNEIADVEHIPVLEKENAGAAYDAFCIIEREKVLIYTKKFSGFSCIIHGQRENFSLQAFLFGSYKKVMEHQEVRLTLYIADELHKFKDYNQRMFGNEVCEGREKKAEKPLELPDCCLNGDDYLEITGTVIGDVSDTWEHKLHPRENRPIETERKIVKMKNLSRCCQSENALPHQVGWYLINKTQSRPSSVIQCVVDIQCIVMADRALSTHTSLIVDELHLRASDRSEVLTEPEKVFELKKFFIQTPELPIKDSLNHRLNEINQRLFGRSTNENNLQENLSYLENQMNTDDFIRTIVDILKEMKEYKLLDILNQRKYIADRFLNKPVQTCERDIPINPAQGASNRQIVPEVTSPVGANEPDNISRIYCRSEMVGTRSCSFDHRNINTNGGVPVTLVSRPRAELPTAERDDSDTELKTSELQPNLS